jgi:cytochrome o ubiquinol oxidase subunit IV
MSHHVDTGRAGAARGTLRSYLTGFGLAVLLTALAFGLVMSGALPRDDTVIAIFAAAVLQILVHLHYFLHLDTSSAERWNLAAILFTLIIILILIGGSVWIMSNLKDRTMAPPAISLLRDRVG